MASLPAMWIPASSHLPPESLWNMRSPHHALVPHLQCLPKALQWGGREAGPNVLLPVALPPWPSPAQRAQLRSALENPRGGHLPVIPSGGAAGPKAGPAEPRASGADSALFKPLVLLPRNVC